MENATAYTDVSYGVNEPTISYAWLIILPNGDVIGPKVGNAQPVQGENPEEIPKRKVRKHAQHHGLTVVIQTDHPKKGAPDEVRCKKRDPWHLVCHYASKWRNSQSKFNRERSPKNQRSRHRTG